MDDALLLTVKEVADLLRTTEGAVYNMLSRGKLPGAVKVGRRTLIKKADLFKHLGLDVQDQGKKREVAVRHPRHAA